MTKLTKEEWARGVLALDELGRDSAATFTPRLSAKNRREAQRILGLGTKPKLARRAPGAAQYVQSFRKPEKQAYAQAYERWLRFGRSGAEPEPEGLSVMAAQTIRLSLDRFYSEPELNPRARKPPSAPALPSPEEAFAQGYDVGRALGQQYPREPQRAFEQAVLRGSGVPGLERSAELWESWQEGAGRGARDAADACAERRTWEANAAPTRRRTSRQAKARTKASAPSRSDSRTLTQLPAQTQQQVKDAEQVWCNFTSSARFPRRRADKVREVPNPWPKHWVRLGQGKTIYYRSNKWEDPQAPPDSEAWVNYYHHLHPQDEVWVADTIAQRLGVQAQSPDERLPATKLPQALTPLATYLGLEAVRPGGKLVHLDPQPGSSVALASDPAGQTLYVVEDPDGAHTRVVAMLRGPKLRVEARGLVY